ncbi:hypothetical protein BS47DRAFT_1364978 [Hydnum rufescens UP504]|uniref:Uncharacterized protein n=1 Tax=Hydnum rufescens UP504 TaxID=1448309 RepID=A0A9P6DSV4_9AGAM|nr:hypothetical protein BS47DRAFT_1364978 [Hydnum rufescens UP504]
MPNKDTKQRMNHTSATAGVWFYTRYCLTTNTKMKTRQRNPPQGMTTPPPHGNQQCDPPKQVPNETCRTQGVKPGQTTTRYRSPTVNHQAMAPLPLKWPATSPPSPDEEAEGTTHPLGQTVPHPLERCDGTTHPTQVGQYHTPTHVYHTPTHAVPNWASGFNMHNG